MHGQVDGEDGGTPYCTSSPGGALDGLRAPVVRKPAVESMHWMGRLQYRFAAAPGPRGREACVHRHAALSPTALCSVFAVPDDCPPFVSCRMEDEAVVDRGASYVKHVCDEEEVEGTGLTAITFFCSY